MKRAGKGKEDERNMLEDEMTEETKTRENETMIE